MSVNDLYGTIRALPPIMRRHGVYVAISNHMINHPGSREQVLAEVVPYARDLLKDDYSPALIHSGMPCYDIDLLKLGIGNVYSEADQDADTDDPQQRLEHLKTLVILRDSYELTPRALRGMGFGKHLKALMLPEGADKLHYMENIPSRNFSIMNCNDYYPADDVTLLDSLMREKYGFTDEHKEYLREYGERLGLKRNEDWFV